jgi:[ribosomal protein S18]-alanine N-acetyltransferase
MRVHLCRMGDLSEVQAILQESPEAANWSPTGLALALTEYPSYFLVASQDEKIVGFISGRRVLDEGEILNLAVRPDLRRRGIGNVLVQQLLQLFFRDGIANVFLEVRLSNVPAIAFYQRHNFHQVGKRAAYYQNPTEAALILSLQGQSPRSTTGAL